MTRSAYKGFFIHPKLLKKVKDGQKDIKTWSRQSTISPQMVGLMLRVHNGKEFIPVRIEQGMIGMKLGVFSPTRIFKGHSGDKKGKNDKKGKK